jgi:hypothetical protein
VEAICHEEEMKKRKRRSEEGRVVARFDPPEGSVFAALAGQPFSRAVSVALVGASVQCGVDDNSDSEKQRDPFASLDDALTARVQPQSPLELHALDSALATGRRSSSIPVALIPSRLHSAPRFEEYCRLGETGPSFVDALGFCRHSLSLPRPRIDLLESLCAYGLSFDLPNANSQLSEHSLAEATSWHPAKSERREATAIAPSYPVTRDSNALSRFAEWVGGVATAGPAFRFDWSAESTDDASTESRIPDEDKGHEGLEQDIRWAVWSESLFAPSQVNAVLEKALDAVNRMRASYGIVSALSHTSAPRAPCGLKPSYGAQQVGYETFGIKRALTVAVTHNSTMLLDSCCATGPVD